MLVRMLLVSAALLCACGDDGTPTGSDDAPGASSYLFSGVTIPALGDDVVLASESFNHPMIVSDGMRTHAVGKRIRAAPYSVLSWFDGLAPTHAMAFDATVADDRMTPTMIVPDGSGGAYVSGMLSVPSLSSYDPGVIHFDTTGAVVWSKRYSAASPYWSIIPATGTSSGVAVSAPINGKLAVAGGSGVLAIDTTGAVLWARSYTAQMQMHQLLADATGFTAYAVYYNDVYQFRFDWSGTLVSTQHAPGAFAMGIYAPKLQTPYVDSAGRILLSYGVSKLAVDNMSGVMALDASGALVDNFSYTVVGEENPVGTRNVLHDNGVTRVLSGGVVEVSLIYADTSTPPPYVYHRPRFVLGVDAAGAPTQKLSQNEGSYVAAGSNVLSIGNASTGAGAVGAACSYLYYEITSVTKVAGKQPITPFVSSGETPVTLTVTARDVPITTADGGIPVSTAGRCP